MPFSAESGEDESSADAGGGFVMTETVGHYVDEEGNQARAFSNLSMAFVIYVIYVC